MIFTLIQKLDHLTLRSVKTKGNDLKRSSEIRKVHLDLNHREGPDHELVRFCYA